MHKKNSNNKFKKLMELYSNVETLFNILFFIIISCSYLPRFYGYVGQGSSLYWCKALDILDQNPSIFWYVVVDILVQGIRYFGFMGFDILVLRCFGMPPMSPCVPTFGKGIRAIAEPVMQCLGPATEPAFGVFHQAPLLQIVPGGQLVVHWPYRGDKSERWHLPHIAPGKGSLHNVFPCCPLTLLWLLDLPRD